MRPLYTVRLALLRSWRHPALVFLGARLPCWSVSEPRAEVVPLRAEGQHVSEAQETFVVGCSYLRVAQDLLYLQVIPFTGRG